MIKELWILIKMLFASKPSDVFSKEMEVVTMKHFPFKGYKALAWCGKVIHREGASEIGMVTMNHEKIHVMQAMMCDDSWIKYYLAYLWEWLRRGFLAPFPPIIMYQNTKAKRMPMKVTLIIATNFIGKILTSIPFLTQRRSG